MPGDRLWQPRGAGDDAVGLEVVRRPRRLGDEPSVEVGFAATGARSSTCFGRCGRRHRGRCRSDARRSGADRRDPDPRGRGTGWPPGRFALVPVLARARRGRGVRPRAPRSGPLPPIVFVGVEALDDAAGARCRPAVLSAVPSLVDMSWRKSHQLAEAPPIAAARGVPDDDRHLARRAHDRGAWRRPGRRVPAVRVAPGRAVRLRAGSATAAGWSRSWRRDAGRCLDASAAAIATEAPRAGAGRGRRGPGDRDGRRCGFQVEESLGLEARRPAGPARTSPTCAACLRELFDPDDRRYRYPFINCTDCGPRFTIIESLPYDRERTSMRASRCAPRAGASTRTLPIGGSTPSRSPAPPAARSVSCSTCVGPGRAGPTRSSARPRILRGGEHRRAEGLGGFHLACDATNERPSPTARAQAAAAQAVRRDGRRRSTRSERWFDAHAGEAAALASSARADRAGPRPRRGSARAVAPGHRRQGAMLPSTPLHHLLLRAVAAPAGDDERQPRRRADLHRRRRGAATGWARSPTRSCSTIAPIVARYDDCVVRVLARRARACSAAPAAFAPAPIALADAVSPTLGTGAELHGAFCLADGDHAFLSQHVGDLDDRRDDGCLPRGPRSRYRRLFGIEPEIVAHDLHPDFLTTRFAEATRAAARRRAAPPRARRRGAWPSTGWRGPVIGVAFDGFGLGEDGTVWGGEFLVGDPGRLEPGRPSSGRCGTRAETRPFAHPWRMALAHAVDAGVLDGGAARPAPGRPSTGSRARSRCGRGRDVAAPPRAGRLFDAVAALRGRARRDRLRGPAGDRARAGRRARATRPVPVRLTASRAASSSTRARLSRRSSPTSAAGARRRRSPADSTRTIAAATPRACRAGADDGLDRVCLVRRRVPERPLTSDLSPGRRRWASRSPAAAGADRATAGSRSVRSSWPRIGGDERRCVWVCREGDRGLRAGRDPDGRRGLRRYPAQRPASSTRPRSTSAPTS